MKISAKQASLLAREVHAKLIRQNIGAVSELLIAKLEAFHEKRKKLKHACKVADEAVHAHDRTLYEITGCRKLDAYDSLSTQISELKENNVPKISEIEDKIILNAMFANGEALEVFIQRIVKEFTKKKSTVAAN